MIKVPGEFDWRDATPDDVIQRYPRLVSHMICESLGYFTPLGAANALLHYKRGEPFFCEWYIHINRYRYDAEGILRAGELVVKDAISRRHTHRGYMADYGQARAIVEHVRSGRPGPEFASWF